MKKLFILVMLLCLVILIILARRSALVAPRADNAQPPAAAAPGTLEPVAAAGNVPLDDFRQWLARFQTAAIPAGAPAATNEGRRLAEARRPAMLALMRENPYAALEQSLKWHEWAALPIEIRALVEEPFSETAELSVIPDCRPINARQTPWQTHRVGMRGEYFDAFVYGRREHMTAKLGLPLQGIRLQQQVALWESAVQPLDARDLSAAQGLLPDGNERTRSWMTGQAIDGQPVAALIGGKIHYFANLAEQHEVATVIAAAEARPGPHTVAKAMPAPPIGGVGGLFDPQAFAAGASLAQSQWTETPKRVLIMKINYTPPATNNYTQAELASQFLEASNVIREMSFSKTWLTNTVVPTTLTISNSHNYWETNAARENGIMDAAKAAAAAAGYVLADYDIYAISMPKMQFSAADAFAGGQNLWINGGPVPVWAAGIITHELGHNYGYNHANFWRGSTGAGLVGHVDSTGRRLEHEEYGDFFDTMGYLYGSYPHAHFGMHCKALFNWIEPNEVINVATSGVYRVRRFDHVNARQLAGTKLALLVTNTAGDKFWVGHRRAHINPDFSTLQTGAYVIWANDANSHRLIDTTRLSQPNAYRAQETYDAALQPGQSWTDPSGTVRITTLGAGGASPNEYLDVDVMLFNAPAFQLFTTSGRATNGLIGSYVNTNLRARLAHEDWRSTPGVTVSGTRVDPAIHFPGNGWGDRAPVGVTGGSDADWENFSVQWDGWVQVNRGTKFATRTDDGSRMWIDFDGNGSYAATAPEFINNNWGNGQAATLGEISATVPPGLYRIRIHYEEGFGGNSCELVTSQAEFDLFTDGSLGTNGLIGSYVNASLRGYSPQDDWRVTQTISGTRRDAYPLFMDNAYAESSWGNRTNVGITGGSNADWDNYSVQWDGRIRLYASMRFSTLSDDSSRLWIDVDNNAVFDAGELINNNWGNPLNETYGDVGPLVAPGTYRIRIQYETTVGRNVFALYGAPQETPGISGYSLFFDGVDDFMVVSNAGLSLPTSEVTVEFWQRTYQQRDQFTFILSPDSTANRFGATSPWGDGNIYWDCGNVFGAGRANYVPGPGVLGAWQHWALVSSVSGNFQRIYRNGVLQTNDPSAMAFVQNAAHLVLGGRAGEAFKGELEEFRIWSVARTQAEIQQNMSFRFPAGSRPGLWAYWRFDEATGTTVTDLSGNGRHGALVGGADWVVSTIPALQTTVTNIVTTLADSGAGSLRAAILGANACDCASTITFGVSGTINLASPLPALTGSVNLLGPGTNNLTINAGGAHSVFHFNPGTTNRVSGLRIANAFSVASGASIWNYGHTVLESCVISNSTTTHGFGGAIANFGSAASLFATNCAFVDNTVRGGDGENRLEASTSGGGGGGGSGMGGAIYSEGPALVLHGCSFLRNVATGGNGGNGGGNQLADSRGGHGGLPNRGDGGLGVNVPGGPGDFGGGAGGGGRMAAGGVGGFGGGGGGGGANTGGGTGGAGGAGGTHGGAGGRAQFSFAGGGGGGAGLGGAVFVRTGVVSIVNCSFTGNRATNGVGGTGSFGAGTGQSGQGVGGALFIHEVNLTVTNSAFAGNDAATGDDDVSISTLVTTLADSGLGSLRQALANAAIRPGADTITFEQNLAGGTISISSAQLLVDDASGAVLITGANLPSGLTLSGGGTRRLFVVNANSTLTLDTLTLADANCFNQGSTGGGAIVNFGTLTLRRCFFRNNRSPQETGGAIDTRGPLTVDGCTFSGNSVRWSGGAIASASTLTVLNSTFAGNTATNSSGGAIYANQTANLQHCTIVSNFAGQTGGGLVFNASAGQATATHCIVAGNTAPKAPDLSLNGAAFVFSLVGYSDGVTNGVNGNLVGSTNAPLNPLLGALRNHGGLTPTVYPLPGSPIINAGNPTFSGAGLTDQRGQPRVFLGRVDIGAVEFVPAGQALNFDGVDDHLILNGAGLNLPTNEITVEFWERVQTVRDQFTFILFPDQPANRVSFSSIRVGGATFWDFGDLFNGGRVVYTAPGFVNTWTHWALVSTRAGNAMRVYRDGLLDASTATNRSFVRYAAALVLGARLDSPQEFFRGELDEFRIWSVARTSAEIQAAMHTGVCAPQPNLWVYWKFDETSGTNVLDYSGNGRHATLVNGTARNLSFAPLGAPGALTIARVTPSQVRLTWSPNAGCVQSAPDVTGPWTEIPGATNGQSIATTPARQFFRMRQ